MPYYVRYEFPADRHSRTCVRDPESDARALAGLWRAIPPLDRSVFRLNAESARAGLHGRLGGAEGAELPGAERLASWLTLVKAPRRVFLEVELQAMNRD